MKTGLTKRQKTTCIYFDEASKTVEIQTHNTALKKRLAQYAAKHPDLCRQTDDDEQGGLTFEIRSEEHTSDSSHKVQSRMPSSA